MSGEGKPEGAVRDEGTPSAPQLRKPSPPNAQQPVVMARIGAPHGVRGGVKLTVFAEDPLALRRYNPFVTPDGRVLKLTSVKASGKAIVADFDGVSDRDGAGALNGTELTVPRHRLPRPQDEDEFYHVDLIGLTAMLDDGTVLGTVRAVVDFGAGDLLELVGPHPAYIPFTQKAVPHVDLAAGTLVVDPPEGLLRGAGDDGETNGAIEGGADGRGSA